MVKIQVIAGLAVALLASSAAAAPLLAAGESEVAQFAESPAILARSPTKTYADPAQEEDERRKANERATTRKPVGGRDDELPEHSEPGKEIDKLVDHNNEVLNQQKSGRKPVPPAKD